MILQICEKHNILYLVCHAGLYKGILGLYIALRSFPQLR